MRSGRKKRDKYSLYEKDPLCFAGGFYFFDERVRVIKFFFRSSFFLSSVNRINSAHIRKKKKKRKTRTDSQRRRKELQRVIQK